MRIHISEGDRFQGKLSRLVPVVEEMMDTGLLAMSDVSVVRVQGTALGHRQFEEEGSK